MAETLTIEAVKKLEDETPEGQRLAVMSSLDNTSPCAEDIIEGFLAEDWRTHDDGYVRVIDNDHEESRRDGSIRVKPETIEWASYVPA